MRFIMTALAALVLMQAASAQITFNVARDGFDGWLKIEGNGKVSGGGWGVEAFPPFMIPEWLVPDDINETRDVGNDDLEIPGYGEGQLIVEISIHLIDIYNDWLEETAIEMATDLVKQAAEILRELGG